MNDERNRVKLPIEIRPTVIPLPVHNPLCEIKVKCPVCDELMLPYTVEPCDKLKPVMRAPCWFRMCPRCRSTFSFPEEAQQIVWKEAHK